MGEENLELIPDQEQESKSEEKLEIRLQFPMTISLIRSEVRDNLQTRHSYKAVLTLQDMYSGRPEKTEPQEIFTSNLKEIEIGVSEQVYNKLAGEWIYGKVTVDLLSNGRLMYAFYHPKK